MFGDGELLCHCMLYLGLGWILEITDAKTALSLICCIALYTMGGWLDKIDQTQFLDQTDYLTGKLPDQTEVQIRNGSSQTLKPN